MLHRQDSTTRCLQLELPESQEFFEGAGDYLAGGVQFFIDTVDIFRESYPEAINADGKLIRGDDENIVAVRGGGFEPELFPDPDAIDNLVSVIDTQRFILLCGTYTYMDEFRERQDKLESEFRQVMGRDEPVEEPGEIEVGGTTTLRPRV